MKRKLNIVLIASSGNTHRDIAVPAARAGKHVRCEKPLANTEAEARAMRDAERTAGVSHGVNFNYRKLPAVALAKSLVSEGRLGRLLFFRGTCFQDWTLTPDLAYVWRFDRAAAGAGSSAENGSHVVDLARPLCGEFTEVAATAEIFAQVREGRSVFEATAKGTEASPNFDDGWRAQRELDAVEAAAREKRRISL
jgi:predicted dehydrogenase